MITPSPYAFKQTVEERSCPIGCCPVRARIEDLEYHIHLQHPEPPIPAEIIFLTKHTSEVANR